MQRVEVAEADLVESSVFFGEIALANLARAESPTERSRNHLRRVSYRVTEPPASVANNLVLVRVQAKALAGVVAQNIRICRWNRSFRHRVPPLAFHYRVMAFLTAS